MRVALLHLDIRWSSLRAFFDFRGFLPAGAPAVECHKQWNWKDVRVRAADAGVIRSTARRRRKATYGALRWLLYNGASEAWRRSISKRGYPYVARPKKESRWPYVARPKRKEGGHTWLARRETYADTWLAAKRPTTYLKGRPRKKARVGGQPLHRCDGV